MFFDFRHCTIARQLTLSIVLLSPALLSGCAGFQWIDWKKADVIEATETNPVTRVICIWEPAEGHGADGLPTRGVAGQILFFTKQHPQPVIVNGDVRIYLFDDRGSLEERAKPIHQFDFLGDAWKVHAQQSTLGPAYNVFIPYVRKHSEQVTCGLQVRLTPTAGPAMFSQMVHVTLPGSVNEDLKNSMPGSSLPDKTLAKNAGTTAAPLGATLKTERVVFAQGAQAANAVATINDPSDTTPVRVQQTPPNSTAGQIQLMGYQPPETTPETGDDRNNTLTSRTSEETIEAPARKPRSHRLSAVTTAEWEEEVDSKPHPLADVPARGHPLLE